MYDNEIRSNKVSDQQLPPNVAVPHQNNLASAVVGMLDEVDEINRRLDMLQAEARRLDEARSQLNSAAECALKDSFIKSVVEGMLQDRSGKVADGSRNMHGVVVGPR